jgi:hypothetical protein
MGLIFSRERVLNLVVFLEISLFLVVWVTWVALFPQDVGSLFRGLGLVPASESKCLSVLFGGRTLYDSMSASWYTLRSRCIKTRSLYAFVNCER